MVWTSKKFDQQKAEAWPYYDSGGRAVARLIAHDPSKANEIWALMGPTGIWKKWYLRYFLHFWKEENWDEYNAAKQLRYDTRKRQELRQKRVEAAQEKALAKLNRSRPGRGPKLKDQT